jgi:hypothetical protein
MRLSRLLPLAALAGALAFAAVSCGGTQKSDADKAAGSGDDLDSQTGAGAADAGPPPADAAPPPARVTFVLKNTAAEELALNLDRGWGAVILAWSGKPPKAKPILMFPTFCTSACDAAEAERCPVCEQPEKVADIRKAQKLEKVAPGGEVEVRWEAEVHSYEKTRVKEGARKKCECYRTQEVPPETYTVRACGLRLSTTTGQSSRLVCAEGQMTLPADEPIRVELDFAK